jgi:hypothetical protein
MNYGTILLTVAEASEISGIGISLLHYHIRKGHLPTRRLGPIHIILPEDLEVFSARKKDGYFKRGWYAKRR